MECCFLMYSSYLTHFPLVIQSAQVPVAPLRILLAAALETDYAAQ